VDAETAYFLAHWMSEALPDLAVLTLTLFGTMLGMGLLTRLSIYLIRKT